MQIIKKGTAGTTESCDVAVTVEPRGADGVEITLNSPVLQQYGSHIESVIRDTLAEIGVASAFVSAIDKGALDCVIAARTIAAAYRGAGYTDYNICKRNESE